MISLVSATTTVTLNSPADKTNNTLNIITFNCSAETSTGFLTNISLYTNSTGTWHRNLTVEHTNTTSNTTIGNPSFEYISGGLQNWSFWGSTADVTGNYTNTLSVSGNKSYLMIDDDGSGVNDMSIYQLVNFSSIGKDYDYGYIGVWVRRTAAYDRVYIRINETNIGAALEPSINTWTYYYREIPETYTKSTELFNLTFYFDQTTSAKSNWYIDDIKISTINKQQTFPFNLTSSPTLWNCYSCNNNSECSFAASNYSINYDTTLNSVSYNLTTYETSSENYVLNITSAYTPTNAKLIYNGTEYSATITTSGTTHLISKNLQIPSSSIGSNYFYFKWNVSSTVTEYSINYTQTVSPILFGICNATLTVPYWNISFKDESTLSSINGTLQGSTFVYYLGNGTINKTLSYSVTTNSSSYRFCSLPADRPYYVLPDVNYLLTGYPTRIYNPSLLTLTNSTTNTTLYLLSGADGIYVTFITASTSNTPISGVDIEITRVLGGSTTTIFSGITDSAGSVTVWLNPNYDHTITASKTGYTTNTQTIKPTQSQYTLTMETGLDDYEYVPDRKGLKWFAFPSSGVIKTTNYTLFGYNVSAKNDNLVSCKLELLNSNKTIIITSAETFATNSTLCSVSINYSMNYSKVKGRLLVDLGDGYKILEDDAYWSLVEYNTTGSTLLDWFRGLDELEVSYFNDDEQHREYTYILLFFLVVMIICASLNRMGWDIQTNGGMIFLVGILIWAASISGFLTLSDISPFAIIDKFFVAIIYTMFMIGFAMRELT